MASGTAWLHKVLKKLGQRYERKGRLSGVMKVGNSLHFDQLSELQNFFGIEPIRINRNNDVHILLDKAVSLEPESFWLQQISTTLGYQLKQETGERGREQREALLACLQLAFPGLQRLTDGLREEEKTVRKLFTLFPAPDSAREVKDICFQLFTTIEFLQHNSEPVTISELGARFFGNSKILRQGEIRSILLHWLSITGRAECENEEQLLAAVNIYHDRLTVNALLYGPIIYRKNGQEYDWIHRLYQIGEAATISWSNLQEIDEMYWHTDDACSNPPRLICCENEAPFSLHMRQRPQDCLLFTSGFPNSAVQKVYRYLAPKASCSLHWGDTDPNGLRIAAILNEIHPLQLYRCDANSLLAHQKQLLPLTEKQRRAAYNLLDEVTFPFRRELLLTVEKGWLEQESWCPDQQTK